MQWIAAAAVLVCLVILVADFSQRWGRPRMWLDLRSPVTWAVAAVAVVVLAIVAVVD